MTRFEPFGQINVMSHTISDRKFLETGSIIFLDVESGFGFIKCGTVT